jgi:hypothetical protein
MLAAVLAGISSSCGHSIEPERAQGEPSSVSPAELISTAEIRKGQAATVRGYFNYVTDTGALWENRDAYLDAAEQRKGVAFDYWSKCISVYVPPGYYAGLFNGREVFVTGIVEIVEQKDRPGVWTCNRVELLNSTITLRLAIVREGSTNRGTSG